MTTSLPVPAAREAERSVLGMCLKDGSLAGANTHVRPDDFFIAEHRDVWTAMLTVVERGVTVDPVTVAQALVAATPMREQQAGDLLESLVDDVGSTIGFDHHLRLVLDASMKRAIISAATDVASRGYSADVTLDELREMTDRLMFAAVQRGTGEPKWIGEFAMEAWEDIVARHEGRAVPLTSTGFRELDATIGGIAPPDLIVVAGETSMGKSAFAFDMAENVAIQGPLVLAFSLEMSGKQIGQRRIAAASAIDLLKLRFEPLTVPMMDRAAQAVTHVSGLRMLVDPTPGVPLRHVRSVVRRMTMRHGPLGLVVVDYLQLMTPEKGQSREEKVAMLSRGLKAIAKEANVPVMALAQLNREVSKRGDRKPKIGDLRESAAIENDADLILFVYREWVHNKEADPREGTIIVAKQRNGPRDVEVPVRYEPRSTHFSDRQGAVL